MKRVVTGAGLTLLLAAAVAAQFTPWSAPVNLGPVINTEYDDSCVSLSKNRLHLYFASPRPGGPGGWDLYVSRRASVSDPWGKPELVPKVNSSVQDSCPALSADSYRVYFVSARSGGCVGLISTFPGGASQSLSAPKALRTAGVAGHARPMRYWRKLKHAPLGG